MAFTTYPAGADSGFSEESAINSEHDRLISALGGRMLDFVVDPFDGTNPDFDLSTSGSSLDVTVEAGTAFMGGHLVISDSGVTKTLNASVTSEIFLVVRDSATGNAEIVAQDAGTDPTGDYVMKLWEATTDSSGVTGTTDFRQWVPFRDDVPADNITGRQHGEHQFTVDSTGVQTQAITFPHAYINNIDQVALQLTELSDTGVSLAYPPRVQKSTLSTTGFTVEINVQTAGGTGATLTVGWTSWGE